MTRCDSHAADGIGILGKLADNQQSLIADGQSVVHEIATQGDGAGMKELWKPEFARMSNLTFKIIRSVKVLKCPRRALGQQAASTTSTASLHKQCNDVDESSASSRTSCSKNGGTLCDGSTRNVTSEIVNYGRSLRTRILRYQTASK